LRLPVTAGQWRGMRRSTLAWLCALLLATAAGSAAGALRVAVISDLNGSYGSTRYEPAVREAVEGIVALKPDLVLSTGDMVAGQRLHPPLEAAQVEAMWKAFHATVTEPIRDAGIPLAVTPGNHDASEYPGFRSERERYGAEWQARRPALHFVDASRYPFDYAFGLQDVLFVSLDVTRVGALHPEQRQWLDALLAEHAPRYRHHVVFSHLPVHPFTQGRETEVSGDLELERLLAHHGVELYLSGHHHAFYPGYHAGIRYVSQACLGAGARRLIGAAQRAERAVTWLEFDDEGVRIEARTGKGLAGRIDLEALPRAIRTTRATLLRDDLRPPTPATPAARVPSGSGES